MQQLAKAVEEQEIKEGSAWPNILNCGWIVRFSIPDRIVYVDSGQTGQLFFENKRGTRRTLEVTLNLFANGRFRG